MSTADSNLNQQTSSLLPSSNSLVERSTSLPNLGQAFDHYVSSSTKTLNQTDSLTYVAVKSNQQQKYIPLPVEISIQPPFSLPDNDQDIGGGIVSRGGSSSNSSESQTTTMERSTSIETGLGDSEEDEREVKLIPPISTHEETLSMKQYPPSLEKDKYKPRKCFRVRDDKKNRRYYVVNPGKRSHKESEYLILDVMGQTTWSVNYGSSRTQKILRKPARDYYILLVRRNWTSLQKKLIEGYAVRDGQAHLVLSIRGDELDRKFTVEAGQNMIATIQRDTQIIDFARSIPLDASLISNPVKNYTVSRWSISVGTNVDTALMTAIFACVDKWIESQKHENQQRSSRRRSSGESSRSSGSSSSRGQR